MGACVSKCKCSPTSTADSLCGGSPTSNHHHVQDPLPADADADPDAAADASPTPTTTASTSLLSTTSSVSMATSTISSSSATCSSSVFVKARPRLQGSELETSWDVVVLDPSKNKLLSAVTASSSSSSSSTPRVLVRGGHPLPSNDPGRSKRARPVSPRPAPRPGCKKPCTSPKRTGTPASGRQHQRAEQEASFLPRVGRHRHSRSRSKSRVTLESSSRGAMAAAAVGGGELADDLNNPLISMDCFIFL